MCPAAGPLPSLGQSWQIYGPAARKAWATSPPGEKGEGVPQGLIFLLCDVPVKP